MPRIGLFNMMTGFVLISLAAMGGAFVANDATLALAKDPALLSSWAYTLQKSSHGHTSLFGNLHILFALTLPYSRLSSRVKLGQTFGLCLGSVGMSAGMLVRSYWSNAAGENSLDYLVALLLTAAMVALVVHVFGLMWAFIKR